MSVVGQAFLLLVLGWLLWERSRDMREEGSRYWLVVENVGQALMISALMMAAVVFFTGP